MFSHLLIWKYRLLEVSITNVFGLVLTYTLLRYCTFSTIWSSSNILKSYMSISRGALQMKWMSYLWITINCRNLHTIVEWNMFMSRTPFCCISGWTCLFFYFLFWSLQFVTFVVWGYWCVRILCCFIARTWMANYFYVRYFILILKM